MLGIIGGKYAQTKFLYANCPSKNEYNTLVLNFSGMAWLYLKQDFSHCKQIVFNDICPYTINMLKAFSQPEKFLEVFEYYMSNKNELHINSNETLSSAKDRFSELYKIWNNELFNKKININQIDFDASVKYAFLRSHSFAGRHPQRSGCNFRGKTATNPNFIKVVNKLKRKECKGLLQRVIYENMDFEDCFQKYDTPRTFFYVDPPYWQCESDYNVDNDLFGVYGHIRLADSIKKLEGKAMISYYDFPYLENLYPSNQFSKTKEGFHKPSGNFKNENKRSKEIIITNYSLSSIANFHTLYPIKKDIEECYLEIATKVCPKDKKRTKKSYTTDFKRVIVDLINMGVKKADLMRQFGIGSYATLKRWQKKYNVSESVDATKLAA